MEQLPNGQKILPVVQVENGGEKLRNISATIPEGDPVTIAGELNKLAANISIGRNMAGVHFYTDYYESLRMGERVTTGILLEHLTQIDEPIEMSFHSFDGDFVHLVKTAGGSEVDIIITDSQRVSVTLEQWWCRHLPIPLHRTRTRRRPEEEGISA